MKTFEVTDFAYPLRGRTECQKMIRLNEQLMKEVSELNYIGSIPCKQGYLEG